MNGFGSCLLSHPRSVIRYLPVSVLRHWVLDSMCGMASVFRRRIQYRLGVGSGSAVLAHEGGPWVQFNGGDQDRQSAE